MKTVVLCGNFKFTSSSTQRFSTYSKIMELTPEVDFSQRLACNQPKLRDKALKKVGKWLANKQDFTEDSLMKLWKGLFYYFWNADKPLFQEEKADVICSYIHDFKSVECSFLYIDTFFQTMSREWLAIDRYRLEKFMLLVRKFLNQTYQLLQRLKWKLKWIKRFRNVLKKTVIGVSESIPLGLKLHISDIYMEELAKVGANELSPETVENFLVPYCRILLESDDPVCLNSVSKDVFLYLVNQDVDEEQFHEFPVLNFDATSVQKLLMTYANKPGVKKLNMKIIYGIVKEYEDYKNGISSADRVFSDKSTGKKLKKRDIDRAALSLVNEEKSISEEKKQIKRKKKRKIDEDDIEDL